MSILSFVRMGGENIAKIWEKHNLAVQDFTDKVKASVKKLNNFSKIRDTLELLEKNSTKLEEIPFPQTLVVFLNILTKALQRGKPPLSKDVLKYRGYNMYKVFLQELQSFNDSLKGDERIELKLRLGFLCNLFPKTKIRTLSEVFVLSVCFPADRTIYDREAIEKGIFWFQTPSWNLPEVPDDVKNGRSWMRVRASLMMVIWKSLLRLYKNSSWEKFGKDYIFEVDNILLLKREKCEKFSMPMPKPAEIIAVKEGEKEEVKNSEEVLDEGPPKKRRKTVEEGEDSLQQVLKRLEEFEKKFDAEKGKNKKMEDGLKEIEKKFVAEQEKNKKLDDEINALKEKNLLKPNYGVLNSQDVDEDNFQDDPHAHPEGRGELILEEERENLESKCAGSSDPYYIAPDSKDRMLRPAKFDPFSKIEENFGYKWCNMCHLYKNQDICFSKKELGKGGKKGSADGVKEGRLVPTP